MSERLTLALDAYVGMRIDRALTAAHPALSRAQWQTLIKDGQVTVAGQPVKASLKLEGGEVAEALLSPVVETELLPEAIPLTIAYEDEALLVIDKPAGMVVHPAAGHEQGTLVNAILHHCPDLPGIGGEKRPGIVHRLDKDTSGLIVVAKSERVLRGLQQQFRQRTVDKEYLALAEGHVQPPVALIDAPIGRDPQQRKRMAVIARGSSASARDAQTQYELIAYYDSYSYLSCSLYTGRTHQIRVHLAYVGHPLVGDTVYGRRKQTLLPRRHFLHAHRLAFGHPLTNAPLQFESPLPAELQAVLDRLA